MARPDFAAIIESGLAALADGRFEHADEYARSLLGRAILRTKHSRPAADFLHALATRHAEEGRWKIAEPIAFTAAMMRGEILAADDPALGESFALLGRCWAMLEDHPLGAAYLAKALAILPGTDDIEQQLRQLRQRMQPHLTYFAPRVFWIDTLAASGNDWVAFVHTIPGLRPSALEAPVRLECKHARSVTALVGNTDHALIVDRAFRAVLERNAAQFEAVAVTLEDKGKVLSRDHALVRGIPAYACAVDPKAWVSDEWNDMAVATDKVAAAPPLFVIPGIRDYCFVNDTLARELTAARLSNLFLREVRQI